MGGWSHEKKGIARPAARGAPQGPRLLDEVRGRLRRLGLARRTEEAYVGWIRRFILANGKRHPRELGECEVEAFLTALATEADVAASTQNQALSALLFLYREVLAINLPWMENIRRAKRPDRLPVVLALWLAWPVDAPAQSLPEVVRCEADGMARVHCGMDTRQGVDLVRQISESACIRESDWGTDAGGVWVARGCRAEFVARRETARDRCART